MQLSICLNGTNVNPYAKMGLTQNPFPQTGDARLDGACLRMQALGGEPIPHDDYENYIRKHLTPGFTEEVIQICLKRFTPGEYVECVIRWGE